MVGPFRFFITFSAAVTLTLSFSIVQAAPPLRLIPTCKKTTAFLSQAKLSTSPVIQVGRKDGWFQPLFPAALTHRDVYVRIAAKDLEQALTMLRRGGVREDIEAVLEAHRDQETQAFVVPLSSIVPEHVAPMMGTRSISEAEAMKWMNKLQKSVHPSDVENIARALQPSTEPPCYYAACNFRTPYPLIRWASAQPMIDYLDTYRFIEPGEQLEYGDILFFWRQSLNGGGLYPTHAAVYIGGDIAYQKMGPNILAGYELIELRSLLEYLSPPESLPRVDLTPDTSFFDPIVLLAFRYDPTVERDQTLNSELGTPGYPPPRR